VNSWTANPDSRFDLPSANEVHYFDPVAFTNGRVGKSLTPDDLQIVLDGDPARVEAETGEQLGDGERLPEFVRFAVDGDEHVRQAA